MFLPMFLAVLPVVVILAVIYFTDTQKEPVKPLLLCFIFGCLSVIPIIFIELGLGELNFFDPETSPFGYSFYDAFIVAALVEECAKFLVLFLIIWKHKEFDQHYDGIVYAVFASLGFAFIENILYVINASANADGGLSVSILRAILSVPGHGLFGVSMGYFFSLAKFSENNKKKYLSLAVLVPILFHGAYNFFLNYMSNSGNNTGLIVILFVAFVVFIVYMWRFGIIFAKTHHIKDKATVNR